MTFSVLICTYSKEQPDYLEKCLASLRDQTMPAEEIILVKDGALTTALDNVILKFTDLPIRTILYEGDGHLGGALSLGIQKCSFDIVARMDSDDVARPDRFEMQWNAFRSTNATVLGGQIEEFNVEPGDLRIRRQVPTEVTTKDVWRRNPFNHMTVMFSRKAVLLAGNYQPLSGFEDWYLWLRMYKQGARLRNLDHVLVDARVGNNFLGRRSGPHYAIAEFRAIRRFYNEGLIGFGGFISSILIRFPIRMLPNWLTKSVYLRVLRK